METNNKTDNAKELLQFQQEIEEELDRKKKLREAKEATDVFIQSHIYHEAKIKYQEQLEQEELEEARRYEKVDTLPEEEELDPEEEERQMQEADSVVDIIGSILEELSDDEINAMIRNLVTGRDMSQYKKAASSHQPEETVKPMETVKVEAAVQKSLSPAAKSEEAVQKSQIAPAPSEAESSVSLESRAIMMGNVLTKFSRFISAETPLSAMHAEAGRLCANILKRANKMNLTPEQMHLSQEDMMAIRGGIQMGLVVKRGLEAKEALRNAPALPPLHRQEYLKDFLSMKALEQALVPHVQAHQDTIHAGDVPISSVQILLGNPGFSARDIRAMVGASKPMHQFSKMAPSQIQTLVEKPHSREIDALGKEAMASCYDHNLRHQQISPETKTASIQLSSSQRVPLHK